MPGKPSTQTADQREREATSLAEKTGLIIARRNVEARNQNELHFVDMSGMQTICEIQPTQWEGVHPLAHFNEKRVCKWCQRRNPEKLTAAQIADRANTALEQIRTETA